MAHWRKTLTAGVYVKTGTSCSRVVRCRKLSSGSRVGGGVRSYRLWRVSPQIDVISGVRSSRVELTADRSTIGKAAENEVALPDDATASHLHAVLERFAAGWCVTDLGSSNGTWVNGERIWASRRLRHGDEIRIGQTRLLFRDPLTAAGAPTEAELAPPGLTPRERDVLVALCRPLLARDMFTEPAPTRAIAEELVITQAAVKQHLANLYDKFGVGAGDDHRRARLANEALRRGAVTTAGLRAAVERRDEPRG
jgi:pSer/pThr/pTyr-binding forkhead associated (FHA) protein